MKTLFTILLACVATTLFAQVSMLPASLKNVSHDYSNMTITTPTAKVILNATKLIASDVDLLCDEFQLLSSSIKSTRELRFSSSVILMDASLIDAQRISFTKPTIKLTVNGKVRITCRDFDLGISTIDIVRGPAGGSLTVEYTGTFHNTGQMNIADGVNVVIKRK